MVQLSNVILSLGLFRYVARAAPLEKRIAQTISASTTQWEQACVCPLLLLLYEAANLNFPPARRRWSPTVHPTFNRGLQHLACCTGTLRTTKCG